MSGNWFVATGECWVGGCASPHLAKLLHEVGAQHVNPFGVQLLRRHAEGVVQFRVEDESVTADQQEVVAELLPYLVVVHT